MICKIGQRFDHLVVIAQAGINMKQRLVTCRCDCGRELNKNDQRLRKPTVKYKACGFDDCEYSGIDNLEQDMEYFEKLRKGRNTPEHEKKKVIRIDMQLGRQLTTMAWHS